MRTSAVSGVISEGFITIVHPTANAGATFHALDGTSSGVSTQMWSDRILTTSVWDSSMEFCGKVNATLNHDMQETLTFGRTHR